MAAKSTRAPARRKSKNPTIYPLSRYEIEHRAYTRGLSELSDYINSLTEAEKKVVGHVCPFGDPVAGMNEMRRLLGESIAKCKVILFPAGGKRGTQLSKEV